VVGRDDVHTKTRIALGHSISAGLPLQAILTTTSHTAICEHLLALLDIMAFYYYDAMAC